MNAFSKLSRFALLCLTALVVSSFSNNPALSQEREGQEREDQKSEGQKAESIEFEVLRQLPHDQTNFTQGLFFHEGSLYESVGQYGRSKLIRYNSDFHTPLLARSVPAKYFAEGATVHEGVIYQLTWQAGTALAYKPGRLAKMEGFSYDGEGWGLISDGEYLWLSDGSDTLNKLDANGTLVSTLKVSLNGNSLNRLNELEWVKGQIYANRWYDNRIYVIDPESGSVNGLLDLEALAAPEISRSRENVLNGVAWNPETQTLWVTGKNWKSLYELKLREVD